MLKRGYSQKDKESRKAESEQSIQSFSSNEFTMARLSGQQVKAWFYCGVSPPPPPPSPPPPPPPRFQDEESMAWLPLVDAWSMGSTPATTVMAVADCGD